MKSRILKTTAVLSLALQSGQLAQCFVSEAQVRPTAAGVQVAGSTLDALLDQYFSAVRSGSALRKSLGISRIRRHVFEQPGSPNYLQALQRLDVRSGEFPTASFELARALQLHWESRYAAGLGPRQAQRLNTSTQAGAIVGMAALGAALFYRPQAAPRYFRLVRHLLPLTGVAAGNGAGQILNQTGMLDGNVPVSPAHVMRLGISQDEFHYDDHSMIREISALTASIAASSIAYDALAAIRVVRAANLAATPAKLNPYVLVGSIVVGLVVEQGATAAINAWEYDSLREKVIAERVALDAAIRSGDDALVLLRAERLVQRTVNLAAFLNHPIHEAIGDFTSRTAEAAQRYGEGTHRFASELLDATRDLQSEIRESLEDRDFDRDSAYETQNVLSFLQAHDETSIGALSGSARDRAQMLQSLFNRYLETHEDAAQQCISGGSREHVFQDFIEGFRRAEDRRLAVELRNGALRKEAKHTLLQVAALLRNTGKEYLSDQVDFLMTLITREDLLTAQTFNHRN